MNKNGDDVRAERAVATQALGAEATRGGLVDSVDDFCRRFFSTRDRDVSTTDVVDVRRSARAE